VQSALQAPEPVTGAGAAAGGRCPPPLPADDEPPGRQALARLVGESAVMRSVKRRIAKVARSMAPVLVHGESGTGKELVARAMHACSHRRGPFVPVNCGAIPDNLLEAEFFGARKGSYTGAMQDREGFFQAAAGGTLFLDEIGDLPLAMQASCCAPSRSAACARWGPRRKSRWTCASSAPRTRTWPRPCTAAPSGRICSIA
jgi:two-component system response regulator PilR (NtrC family)